MVINPAPVALPVNTANIPTEAVRNDTRQLERVPETKPSTESVKLKPSTEEAQQSGRPNETRNSEATSERQVQEKGREEGGTDRDGNEQNSRQNQRDDRDQREQQELTKLKLRDQEVRAHEAAHAAVGGRYTGAPSYTYERGPDGRRYAIGGEVPIDTSRVAGDPAATIEKMQQVRRAALAPVDPSTTDQQVAAQASAIEADARAELLKQQQQEQAEARSNSRERFEGRLRNLGVVATPERGDTISVVA